MRYLTLEQVYRLHQRALLEKGGMPGVRDAGAVESAIAQPQMTFGGEDLYRHWLRRPLHWPSRSSRTMRSRMPTSAWAMPRWKPSW